MERTSKIEIALENNEIDEFLLGEPEYYFHTPIEYIPSAENDYRQMFGDVYAYDKEHPETNIFDLIDSKLLEMIKSKDPYYICFLSQVVSEFIKREKKDSRIYLPHRKEMLTIIKQCLEENKNLINDVLSKKFRIRMYGSKIEKYLKDTYQRQIEEAYPFLEEQGRQK